MARTVFDIMDTTEESLSSFERACDELFSAKYILADRKISKLLQTIAGSKKLYALMSECMVDFDFGYELSMSKQEDENSRNFLITPASRKKNIAFVFCLLLSFDTNQTDLKKFLHTFYYHPKNPNAEFYEFNEHLIRPFKKHVLNEYYNVTDEYEEDFDKNQMQLDEGDDSDFRVDSYQEEKIKVIAKKEDFNQSTPLSQLDSIAINTLLNAVKEIIGIVARDSTIDIQEKEELLLVCEALEKAVEHGGKKSIRIMYLAVKNTILCSSLQRQLQMQADDISRLINAYGIG